MAATRTSRSRVTRRISPRRCRHGRVACPSSVARARCGRGGGRSCWSGISSRGDIALIDHLDIDRVSAEELIAAGAAAVLNCRPSSSGAYPNLGPQLLVEAGILLVDLPDDSLFATRRRRRADRREGRAAARAGGRAREVLRRGELLARGEVLDAGARARRDRGQAPRDRRGARALRPQHDRAHARGARAARGTHRAAALQHRLSRPLRRSSWCAASATSATCARCGRSSATCARCSSPSTAAPRRCSRRASRRT